MNEILFKCWPIVAVNVLFTVQIVQLARSGQGPQALICFGYIVANAGLIWSTVKP